MTVKEKRDFRNMMTWAIRKSLENYPEEIINLRELKKQLEAAWIDLVEAGEIVLQNDYEP